MDKNRQEDLFLKYIPDIRRYLFSLSGNLDIVEDCLQETLLKAYRGMKSIQGKYIKAWLLRIAYNVYVDYVRKNKKMICEEIGYFNCLTDELLVEGEVIEKERIGEVHRMINKLDERQRNAVILVYYNDLSYEEGAEVLQVGLSCFKMILFRAKKKLREMFDEVIL